MAVKQSVLDSDKRVCSKCSEEKDLARCFATRRYAGKRGVTVRYRGVCRDCHNERQSEMFRSRPKARVEKYAGANAHLNSIDRFTDSQAAFEFLRDVRWPKGVVCPRCSARDPWFITTRAHWKCRGCRKVFTVRTGTDMEDSRIPLHGWLKAIHLLRERYVPNYEMAATLGITQKSAWYLTFRITRGRPRHGLLRGKATEELPVRKAFVNRVRETPNPVRMRIEYIRPSIPRADVDFERLLHQNRRLIQMLIARAWKNSAQHEDLLQGVLARAWEGRAKFDPVKGKFSTWIGLIVRKETGEWRRLESTQKRGGGVKSVSLDDATDEHRSLAETITDGRSAQDVVFEEMEDRSQTVLASRIITLIGETFRDKHTALMVVSVLLGEKTMQEAATERGCTKQAIFSLISKAKAKVREAQSRGLLNLEVCA